MGSAGPTLAPLATVFLRVSALWVLMWYVGAGVQLVGLVCQVGLFCMSDAGRDIL